MSNLYDRGLHYFSIHDYESAENCFMDALKDGCDKIPCLFNYSVCCFWRTTYQMKGVGFLGGMSRRGNLVMAQKYLREVLDADFEHAETVRYLALCSYTIGKLMPSSDGYTVPFYEYKEILRELDFELYKDLEDDLEGINSQFVS